MKRLIAVVLLLASVCSAQVISGRHRKIFSAGGGGGVISQVSGQNKGEFDGCLGNNSLANITFANSVTHGNAIFVSYMLFQPSPFTPAGTQPTKASGTATIGAFVKEGSTTGFDGVDADFTVELWRAPVTGDGTLILALGNSSACALASIDEFHATSGTIQLDGSAVTNSGTSATEATGNVITSTNGAVIMVSTEAAVADFTYTQSDTNIYNLSTASSTFSGETQYKITGSSGTYNLTAGTANSWFWIAIGVPYKAN